MKANLLLIIFLIIWIGIGGYLFFIDRELRKIKRKLLLQEEESKQN